MFAIVLLLLIVNSIDTASSLGFENDSNHEVTYCINKERQALLTFKAGLIDDDDSLSSWTSEEGNKDCCSWSGVQCSNLTGHVIELDLGGSSLRDNGYNDRSVIRWQGSEREFEKFNLRLLKSIDLSSNKLTGEIPNEITELFEVLALNLSRNALHGNVPQQIGRLNSLLILDLSKNRLSGKLPPSLSELHFLGYLDVSYNNFFGKIPSGTQLQGFNASNYIGNVGLCGPPLPTKCVGDEPPSTIVDNEEDNNEYKKWLHIGLGVGFATGFWGTCGALLLNRRGRHAFFLFLDDLRHWLYVKMAISKGTMVLK